MKNSKGQASVELMVLLAALLAFLLLFMPVIETSRRQTDFLVAKQAQQIALQKIAGAADEAYFLGKATSFSGTVFFPADNTTLSFEEGSLKMVFQTGDRNGELFRKTRFSQLLDGTAPWASRTFSKGQHSFSVNYSEQGAGNLVLSIE